MSKYQEIANSVLTAVGGKANITDVLHCMTRLRFTLKDKELVDLEQVKGIAGVYGAQFAEDALQVVIGPTVDEVYKEIIAATGLTAKAMLDECIDEPAAGGRFTPMGIFNSIINTFSNCMTPLIPLFVALGMVNVIAAIIGPTMLNLVSAESALYTNFYYVGQAIIYFLPVLAAITASKQFKANTMLAVALAGLMVFPDLITALTNGYTVYGIPAPDVPYNGQLIPILLVVWVMGYVERFFKKIIPDAVRVIGVPLGTLLVMLPLTFCALGPVGFYIGSALTGAVLGLYAVAGPVATMVLGAVSLFLTAFGIARPVFFACLMIFMTTGSDYAFLGIAMVLQNFVASGIAAGYTVKAKTAEKKQMGLTAFLACILGGVSEPTLFGVILPERKTYLPVVLSGALSGLIFGILKVGYFQFGPTNFLGVIGFLGAENSNFIFGCVSAGIAFVSALVLMLILYKPQDGEKTI